MPASPDSPTFPDSQPQDTSEQAAWRVRVQALASAADGIRQASDRWDAVSDSYCDEDGWPVDETGYADGKVARDAAAWEHVKSFLAHGPEVLAGVRAAAQPADYLDSPISADLLRLRGIDSVLERASEIRREWDQVIALMEGPMPGRGSFTRNEPARSATPKAGTTPTNSATAERRWQGLPIT